MASAQLPGIQHCRLPARGKWHLLSCGGGDKLRSSACFNSEEMGGKEVLSHFLTKESEMGKVGIAMYARDTACMYVKKLLKWPLCDLIKVLLETWEQENRQASGRAQGQGRSRPNTASRQDQTVWKGGQRGREQTGHSEKSRGRWCGKVSSGLVLSKPWLSVGWGLPSPSAWLAAHSVCGAQDDLGVASGSKPTPSSWREKS